MNPLFRNIAQPYMKTPASEVYQIPETVESLLGQVGMAVDAPAAAPAPVGVQEVTLVPMPRPVIETPEVVSAPTQEGLLSQIGSGLLGAGQAIGSGIGEAAGLFGESLRQPIAAGIADIPDVMRVYQRMTAEGPMMARDPSRLSAVTPMTAAAMLPEIRAAQEAERREMALKEREFEARMKKGVKADEKDEGAQERARQKAYGVISSVDDALAIVDKYGRAAAGFGSLSRFLPETPANLLDKSLDTIKAQIGFAELQAMRDASKTGGALGQVTERELQLLQRTIAAIEPDLSPDALRQNLNKVREVMMAIAHGTEDPRTGKIVSIADIATTPSATVRTYNPETGEIE